MTKRWYQKSLLRLLLLLLTDSLLITVFIINPVPGHLFNGQQKIIGDFLVQFNVKSENPRAGEKSVLLFSVQKIDGN